MASVASWQLELEGWLRPFLDVLCHPARRATCPLYVAGLIGPGERKSVQPMAEHLGLPSHDALHHFIAAGAWNMEPLQAALARKADQLVGGRDAFLIIDDTTLPKKGTSSVGVAPQYASPLGKNANCQTLVSLTLARHEVPLPFALRLVPAGRVDTEYAAPGTGWRAWKSGTRREPNPRSRSPRSTARSRPGCGSAVCWPTRATGSADLSVPG